MKQLSLWYKANDEGQTVLQLAASKGQHELFKWMLELKDIYKRYGETTEEVLIDKVLHKVLDNVRFDITEIDYVALNLYRNSNPGSLKQDSTTQGKSSPGKSKSKNCFQRRKPSRVSPESSATKQNTSHSSTSKQKRQETKTDNKPQETKNDNKDQGKGNATKRCSRAPSVIEIICETMKTEAALEFSNIPLFDDIIDKKWIHYKWRFIVWLILHIVIMALVTAQAVVKAQLISDSQQLMSTTQATTFVYVVGVVLFVFGIIYLVLEGIRVRNRFPRCVFQDKHNVDYHILLLVFSLSIIADAIWSWIQGPQNIYFLAIALIVGGWFFAFFLRPWERFSVFTTMVRNAILRKGLRFVVIILFHFVAFSFAMYVLYLPTPGGPPAEFEHLGMTVLTMFTLMLGLTDLEILTRAPFPWLTVTLFIIFVVLTYILMFNILTALMTDTAIKMSENKMKYWKLQRLAVVVMIEQMMPLCWAFNSAEGRDEDNQRFLSTCFFSEKQAFDYFKKKGRTEEERKCT